ncbi:MAG: YjdF family protein [Ktedonobacterales bacterium]
MRQKAGVREHKLALTGARYAVLAARGCNRIGNRNHGSVGSPDVSARWLISYPSLSGCPLFPHPAQRPPCGRVAQREDTVTKLTVYFDGQFWIGVVEAEYHESLRVARHISGAEPKDIEVLAFVNRHLPGLLSAPTDEIAQPDVAQSDVPLVPRTNPKRRAREAAAEVQAYGVSTRSQAPAHRDCPRATRRRPRTQAAAQARESQSSPPRPLKPDAPPNLPTPLAVPAVCLQPPLGNRVCDGWRRRESRAERAPSLESAWKEPMELRHLHCVVTVAESTPPYAHSASWLATPL